MARKCDEPDPLPPKRFIEIWQASASVAEVAKKARLRKGAVRQRACRYRYKGVPLKVLLPPEPPDWSDLAEYARTLVLAPEVGSHDDDG